MKNRLFSALRKFWKTKPTGPHNRPGIPSLDIPVSAPDSLLGAEVAAALRAHTNVMVAGLGVLELLSKKPHIVLQPLSLTVFVFGAEDVALPYQLRRERLGRHLLTFPEAAEMWFGQCALDIQQIAWHPSSNSVIASVLCREALTSNKSTVMLAANRITASELIKLQALGIAVANNIMGEFLRRASVAECRPSTRISASALITEQDAIVHDCMNPSTSDLRLMMECVLLDACRKFVHRENTHYRVHYTNAPLVPLPFAISHLVRGQLGYRLEMTIAEGTDAKRAVDSCMEALGGATMDLIIQVRLQVPIFNLSEAISDPNSSSNLRLEQVLNHIMDETLHAGFVNAKPRRLLIKYTDRTELVLVCDAVSISYLA